MTASAESSTPPPADLNVTIWHHSGCGSSSAALKYLRERGIEPTVYAYLKERPSEGQLTALLAQLGLPAFALLRPGEPIGESLGVYGRGVSDAQILTAMSLHPKLIQRPVVITRHGAVIARPKTKIDEILTAEVTP